MKQRKVEVISISRDINEKITTLLKITMDDEIFWVKTSNLPQCYGKWGGWAMTSVSACNYCKFMRFCQEDTLKKLVELSKQQKNEEEVLNITWTNEDSFLTG